jgi:hypothetical protein
VCGDDDDDKRKRRESEKNKFGVAKRNTRKPHPLCNTAWHELALHLDEIWTESRPPLCVCVCVCVCVYRSVCLRWLLTSFQNKHPSVLGEVVCDPNSGKEVAASAGYQSGSK